jgi:serine/threonine-protein kinase
VRTGRADVAAGTVFQTDPRAGDKLAKGQTQVTIYVAEAAPTTTVDKVTVPNVVGMTEEDAEASLRSKGLVVQKETSSGGIAGRVRGQNPAAGSRVDPGSTVVITIGTGSGGSSTSSTPPSSAP